MTKRTPAKKAAAPVGMPAHKPTSETRAVVKALASIGIPQLEIAPIVGCTDRTLRKHYRDEIDGAVLLANAVIAGRLFALATQNCDLKVAASTCMFWAKTRMGFRETNKLELTGEDGAPIKTDTTFTVEFVDAPSQD